MDCILYFDVAEASPSICDKIIGIFKYFGLFIKNFLNWMSEKFNNWSRNYRYVAFMLDRKKKELKEEIQRVRQKYVVMILLVYYYFCSVMLEAICFKEQQQAATEVTETSIRVGQDLDTTAANSSSTPILLSKKRSRRQLHFREDEITQ